MHVLPCGAAHADNERTNGLTHTLSYLTHFQAKDELVHSVYAARDSELWAGCEAAGVSVREFGGWAAFAEEVLHEPVAAQGL